MLVSFSLRQVLLRQYPTKKSDQRDKFHFSGHLPITPVVFLIDVTNDLARAHTPIRQRHGRLVTVRRFVGDSRGAGITVLFNPVPKHAIYFLVPVPFALYFMPHSAVFFLADAFAPTPPTTHRQPADQ